MTQNELNEIIKLHELWLRDSARGKQAVFEDTDLSGLSFTRANLSKSKFYGCSLIETNFSCAVLEESEFNEIDLTNALFYESDLTRATIDNASAPDVNFRAAKLISIRVSDSDFSRGYFKDAIAQNSQWYDVNLTDAVLLSANFIHADIRDCNLTGIRVNYTIGNGHAIKTITLGDYFIVFTDATMAIGRNQQHPFLEWALFTDDEIETMFPGRKKWWNENKRLLFAFAGLTNASKLPIMNT